MTAEQIVPVASESNKKSALESGLEVRWHAIGSELVPFVPLAEVERLQARIKCLVAALRYK